MPELKVQGFLGSLGEKKGFAYIMDRTVTGRLAHILKSVFYGYINIIMDKHNWEAGQNLISIHHLTLPLIFIKIEYSTLH